MKRALLLLAPGGAGLYGGVLLLFFFAQRAILFPAPTPRQGTPAVIELAGSPTVVYFHGNGEDLGDVSGMLELLHSLGAGVVAVEYPGYGAAPGKPTEASCYAAAEAALARIHGPVVILGQSLGTGIAVEMAARGHASKLILVSPFTSVPDLGAVHYPWLPARLLVRDRFDSLQKAPRVGVPVLVLHGTQDEVVPFRLGQRLAAALPHARLVEIPGGHHNDLLHLHAAELRRALSGFLRP